MGRAFFVVTMDLALVDMGRSYRLQAQSVLGLLWLQTHFAPESWDLLCSGRVRLNGTSRQSLCTDAMAAGLRVSCLELPRPVVG